MIRSAIALLFLVSLPAQAADATIKSDPLLARTYAEAKDYIGQNHAMQVNWRAQQKNEVIERVLRFDPAKPAGQRWAYLSRNGKPPEAKQLAGMAKQMKDESPDSYGIVGEWLRDASWQPGVGNERSASYTMIPGPNSKVMINGDNKVRDIKLVMVIDNGERPFVRSVSITAPKPFSPQMGATVKSLNIDYAFARQADGEIVPVSLSSRADVSAFFMKMNINDEQRFSQVSRRVPFAATGKGK